LLSNRENDEKSREGAFVDAPHPAEMEEGTGKIRQHPSSSLKDDSTSEASRSDEASLARLETSISSSSSGSGTTSTVLSDEEDEYYPKSFQDELNELIEAFYELVSDEDIRQYQKFVEDVQQRKIAEGAVTVGDIAPSFNLVDQDGDAVSLQDLCRRGPVVLVFYRGKWCPHCNAHIMRLQRTLPSIQARGASLVAISPMLPDGTQYLATKRSLEFPVLSDMHNAVADKYRIAFEVDEKFREPFLKWGDEIPAHNGDFSWKVPLPATYVIDRATSDEDGGRILYAYIDNDPGVRVDPEDVLDAIPVYGDSVEVAVAVAATTLDEADSTPTTSRPAVCRYCSPSSMKGQLNENQSSSNCVGCAAASEQRRRKKKNLQRPTGRSKSERVEQALPLRRQQQQQFNRRIAFTFRGRNPAKKLFGRKKESALDFASHYKLPPPPSGPVEPGSTMTI